MKLLIAFAMGCTLLSTTAFGQLKTGKFGKGIRYVAKDSSFYMKFNVRIQNLMTHEWDRVDDSWSNHSSNALLRRSRIKMDGWAISPKLKYKFEMGLSNRDIGGDIDREYNNGSNLILDASLTWKFYKNFSLFFGQGKLPGNRERVVSSGNLQFVDRSRLNSRYNIDRDFGFQLLHEFTLGQVLFNQVVAVTKGEGRDVTIANQGGYDYTFRFEVLPFGDFNSKGDYVNSAVYREETPKFSLGITYDLNRNAVRERAQLGSFIKDDSGRYIGKTLQTWFVDAMFKYQGWSFMGEYAHKRTDDDDPMVYDNAGVHIGTFYTGSGLNLQAGYMFDNNVEVGFRYTTMHPDEVVDVDQEQYTFVLAKFVAGHNLKIQTDITYSDIFNRNNELSWRTQVEFQF